MTAVYGVAPRDLVKEPEADEYCGWKFTANALPCRFRKGKVTPTKNGQFVTLYDRSPSSAQIVPAGTVGPIPALLMVQCVEEARGVVGHFMFPSSALIANKIVAAANGSGGKLAFRVYPPWVDVESKQAATTQKWQCRYFILDTEAPKHAATVRSYLGLPASKDVCNKPTAGAKRPRDE